VTILKNTIIKLQPSSKEHPEMKVVFQPGTFQMKLGTEVLKDIYANTYAFFCNSKKHS